MSQRIESTDVVEEVLRRLKLEFPDPAFTTLGPRNADALFGEYKIYEVKPARDGAAAVMFVASPGSTEINIETGEAIRFEAYARRRETFDDYVAGILHCARAIASGGWSEKLRLAEGDVVSSSAKIEFEGKTYRSSNYYGVNAPFRRKGKRTIKYQPW